MYLIYKVLVSFAKEFGKIHQRFNVKIHFSNKSLQIVFPEKLITHIQLFGLYHTFLFTVNNCQFQFDRQQDEANHRHFLSLILLLYRDRN